MQIKPDDKTISEILTNRRYKIPSFQRDFSWDKKYYREFLYDMLNQIEAGEVLINKDYFLGTMLFLKDDDSEELKVIDGQQRLTTITILFSAISRLLNEQGEIGLSDATFKYIVFTDRRDKLQKVIYPPNSFPYFTKVIQKTEPDKNAYPKSDEEDLIKETYDYFKDALSENKIAKTIQSAFSNKVESETIDIEQYGYSEVLIALRDQVLDSKLIFIETQSHDQANMIFEILNAKGKQLSAIDLIKNKVFENVGNTVDEEAEVQWKKIQRKLQEYDIPMLVFFRHFWASKYKKTTANSLYASVNCVISKGNKEVKKERTIELLNELDRNVDLYTYIVSPDLQFWDNKKPYQEILDSLFFLKGFNITQYRIAVLALISARRESKINMKWFILSLKCIEEFCFVFFQLLSSRASKIENLFSKFAIELSNCDEKDKTVSIIENTLFKGLKKLMPTYEEFKANFTQLQYTNHIQKDLTDYISVRYVINKINVYYSNNSNFVDKSCSIEHIIPDDENNNITWNIGNLIPLESKINEKLGDSKYEIKKEGYLKSNYNEIKEFVKLNNLWEIEQIEERSETIADLFYNVIIQEEILKS